MSNPQVIKEFTYVKHTIRNGRKQRKKIVTTRELAGDDEIDERLEFMKMFLNVWTHLFCTLFT